MNDRPRLEKAITGALRSTIAAHGDITWGNAPSAAKRIIGALKELRKLVVKSMHHYTYALIDSGLLPRSSMDEAAAENFKKEAERLVMTDSVTKKEVVCYRHPDGRLLVTLEPVEKKTSGKPEWISFEALHEEYQRWVAETFPDETLEGRIEHLKEEVGELFDGGCVDPGEFADVLMLLCCVARGRGIDIFDAFRKKFEINRSRTWSKTERGFRHVEEGTGETPEQA